MIVGRSVRGEGAEESRPFSVVPPQAHAVCLSPRYSLTRFETRPMSEALPTNPSPVASLTPEQITSLRSRLKADLIAPEPERKPGAVTLCPTVRRLLESKRNRKVNPQAV